MWSPKYTHDEPQFRMWHLLQPWFQPRPKPALLMQPRCEEERQVFSPNHVTTTSIHVAGHLRSPASTYDDVPQVSCFKMASLLTPPVVHSESPILVTLLLTHFPLFFCKAQYFNLCRVRISDLISQLRPANARIFTHLDQQMQQMHNSKFVFSFCLEFR